LAGEPGGQLARVVPRDGADPAAPGGGRGPELVHGAADRRDGADAGDVHATLRAGGTCGVACRVMGPRHGCLPLPVPGIARSGLRRGGSPRRRPEIDTPSTQESTTMTRAR